MIAVTMCVRFPVIPSFTIFHIQDNLIDVFVSTGSSLLDQVSYIEEGVCWDEREDGR